MRFRPSLSAGSSAVPMRLPRRLFSRPSVGSESPPSATYFMWSRRSNRGQSPSYPQTSRLAQSCGPPSTASRPFPRTRSPSTAHSRGPHSSCTACQPSRQDREAPVPLPQTEASLRPSPPQCHQVDQATHRSGGCPSSSSPASPDLASETCPDASSASAASRAVCPVASRSSCLANASAAFVPPVTMPMM